MLVALPSLPSRRPLRVAVTLSAPWAFADELCLEGVEVEEVRRYAQWRGRELQWKHVPLALLPLALHDDQVDLAIGGLRATPELVAGARVARYSEQRLDKSLCRHGRGYRHVWAVGPSAWREWAAVNAWLQLVRHRPEFSVASAA